MATPQLSPGVLTREVDLTVGRAENVLDNVGAIAGPFSKGPVNEPVTIATEQQLLNTFGKPSSKNNQYEYWMSASSYLSYGGVLKVVRSDNGNLLNANCGVAATSTSIKIANYDQYTNLVETGATDFYYASKNPGTWANNLKVCVIDDYADQIISVATTSLSGFGAQVGYGVTVNIAGTVIPDPSTGATSTFDGYLKGIITDVIDDLTPGKSALSVKMVSRVSAAGTETPVSYTKNSSYASIKVGNRLTIVDDSSTNVSPEDSIASIGITTSSEINGKQGEIYTGIAGTTAGSGSGAQFTITRNSTNGGILSAVVTNSGQGYSSGNTISIAGTSIGGYNASQGKINGVSVLVSTAITAQANTSYFILAGVSTVGTGASFTVDRNSVGGIGTVTLYNPGSNYAVGTNIVIDGTKIGGLTSTNDLVLRVNTIRDDKVVLTVAATKSRLEVSESLDWYNQQTLGLDNATIYWSSIAPKPTTTSYTSQRGGLNDGMHIVVVDDNGTITGVQGSILEKHIGLSKASDAISEVNSPQKIWYKQYLSDFSPNIYAGTNQSNSIDAYWGSSPVSASFETGSFIPISLTSSLWDQTAINTIFSSIGNITYTLNNGNDYGDNGSMEISLGSIISSYDKFANRDLISLDYLIMGPGLDTISDSQAKANNLIAMAQQRKDCLAVISPHRASVIDIQNSETQTSNIIEFFSPLQSSSYAIFDSGYKYTYDRFNNLFRYIPCNADIAGLICRVNLDFYPWYSPGGQQRGRVRNAIKLAYNPTKSQRDAIYSSRINPIIDQSGAGIILYGDKTALAYDSAFDRINVRRLFLTIEQALEKAAQAQLFEFNDQITRANFVNIVDPYLRDVQAKRGVYDYLVICDETNNTPDTIDNNEFRADIFLKPTKSINYITLTFVATRTGVNFEEVAGRV
jgi:hypothetical protein